MADYPTPDQLTNNLRGITVAELVQTGGQKAVYKADFRGETIALKVVALGPLFEGEDEEAEVEIASVIERVKREVSVQEQFQDPVFAGVGPLELRRLEISEHQWLCFSEKWIEGRSLSEMIRENALTPPQVAQLGDDLIHAVCLLSSQNFVHRDIKPANVMWAEDRSRFVLLDAGVALDQLGPSLTFAPLAVGTIAYQSPEQMDASRKRALDFRSDLFAVGLVMYEASAGRHPFANEHPTISSVVAGILTRRAVPLAERLSGFPRELSDVVDRLLAKEPHLRYRTCGRALDAVRQAAQSVGGIP